MLQTQAGYTMGPSLIQFGSKLDPGWIQPRFSYVTYVRSPPEALGNGERAREAIDEAKPFGERQSRVRSSGQYASSVFWLLAQSNLEVIGGPRVMVLPPDRISLFMVH